jgi:hypothetical protein
LTARSIKNCDFRVWHETDMPTALRDVRSQGQSGKHLLALSSSQFDPIVWSGRALQVDFAAMAVSGLASMYPAFDWSVVLLAIMDISARAISLPDRPQRAIRVTSVRRRREDRTSISSHPLADLGR